MKRSAFGLAAALTVSFSSLGSAAEMVAAEQFGATRVGFLLQGSHHNATLTIAGPNGLHASAFSKAGAVAIDLREFGAVEDGEYAYQLTAASDKAIKTRTPLDNGRDRTANIQPVMDAVTTGTFRVRNGAIVKPKPGIQTSRQDRDAK